MSEAGGAEPRDGGAASARTAEEEARLRGAIVELFERRIVFNEFLGFRIESLGADAIAQEATAPDRALAGGRPGEGHRTGEPAAKGRPAEGRPAEPVRIVFDMRPELVGHFLHGRLHGGVISAVLDVAGGLAVMRGIAEWHADEPAREVLERFAHLGTIDLRVDYLRQGIGERFVASGTLVRLGRRVAAAAMRLENERGTLLATGNATYIVS